MLVWESILATADVYPKAITASVSAYVQCSPYQPAKHNPAMPKLVVAVGLLSIAVSCQVYASCKWLPAAKWLLDAMWLLAVKWLPTVK